MNKMTFEELSEWYEKDRQEHPWRTAILRAEKLKHLTLNGEYALCYDVSDILGVAGAVAVCTTECAVDNPLSGHPTARIPSFTWVGTKGSGFEQVKELRFSKPVGAPDNCIVSGIWEYTLQPLLRNLSALEEILIYRKMIGLN